MSRLLLLGPAHEAAGVRIDEVDGDTVAEVIARAIERYGPAFEAIVAVSQLWVNGNVVPVSQRVSPSDEIEVLPPISGG